MIISVASGKGGTGKTTIATNLAYSLDCELNLLDCDVEEPNSHLFLKPEIKKSDKVYTLVPEIDVKKCTFCKKCTDICRFGAIAIVGKSILTFPELCHSCDGCIEVCPEDAILQKGRELGVVETGNINAINFIHGIQRIGEAMSPPLIKEVKSFIKPDMINIIDAPPGTSCPVIESIKNTDFVLMVTEPTPFGLHDLKLGIEAVKLMNIPCAIVINRSDIGTSKTKEYAKENNIPILMEMPFDRRIAEIYSKGKLIVEELPEWKKEFINLYRKIEKQLEQKELKNQ